MDRISSSTTLRALDAAGHDVRAWCFRCARGDRIDSMVWRTFEARRWPDGLADAAKRFRCKACRQNDQVLLLPASRRVDPQAAGRLVAAFFHGMRADAKQRKTRYGADKIALAILKSNGIDLDRPR